MKKHIRKLVAVICLLLLFPALILAAELSMPKLYAEAYYAALPDMVSRLHRAEGRRLILLGGSSVAFGTDTVLLEELLNQYGFDYMVCPMGLYAAVGTSAMLDLTQPELREGDLVVLMLEPTSETMSEYFGATVYWKCAESDAGLLLLADSSKRAALVGSYFGYLQERWSICRSGDYPVAGGVYAHSSFDERCNMIYERAGNTMLLGYDLAEPIDLQNVTISEDFAEHVRSFCSQAAAVGAQVVFSFGPMNRSAMTDLSEQTMLDYFIRCCDAFSCTPISDPRNYIMDSGWFYDSNFHLNSAGAKVRTIQLAADLLAELGCYEALTFETAEMPVSIATVPYETTGDDAFLFKVLEDNSAFLVAGISDTGLSAEELTVPSMHDGLPVVGFTSDALQDAGNLTQLRLPATIQSLPDAIFASCSNLSRLILEHTDSVCSITEHSLDGADALRIFVPSSAYSLYRDGTGCQQNLWQNYLDRIYKY